MPPDVEFYSVHRGGSGAVVIAHVYRDGEEHQTGVFSNIEQAEAWVDEEFASDEFTAIFAPYIVDAPDWGNERLQ